MLYELNVDWGYGRYVKIPTEGTPLIYDGFNGFEFFVHESFSGNQYLGLYTVSEKSTGFSLAFADSYNDVVKKGQQVLQEKGVEALKNAIEKAKKLQNQKLYFASQNKEQNDEGSVANPLNSSTVDGSMGETEIERMAVSFSNSFEHFGAARAGFIAGYKAAKGQQWLEIY